jgi:predicted amino acid-binding ACT domain protein
MPALYRLRIDLPDRPGALAYVSSALARRALDIVDVSVHEIDGERAIDEIVVRGPTHLNTTALTSDLESVDARLLSSGRCEEPADLVAAALRWSASMVETDDPRAALVEALHRLAHVASAVVLPVESARELEAGRSALARGAPVALRTADLPVELGGPHGAPRWLLAAPDDDRSPAFVAFAARPLSMRFTATEIARVSALLTVYREVAGARAL